jgi:hypothetical protein
MQPLLRTLLAIYLGHLLTDFPFQTRHQVAQKKQGKLRGYLTHGLIHYFSIIVLLAFFVPGSARSPRIYFVILLLTVVHLLIDFCKVRLSAAGDGPWAYVGDQVVHFFTVLFAAWWISPASQPSEFSAILQSVRDVHNGTLLVPVVYVLVIFGGGYLIRFLTRSLAEGAQKDPHKRPGDQLQNAGLYIGWLERFLVVTAILLQSPATVGLILTAKSIARYPEFKSESFAEYFLIGTLLSLSIGILGGIFLTKIMFGHAHLPS